MSETSTFGRFVAVGAVNTGVHYAVYLVAWLLVPYLVAHVLATAGAMSVSYLLNCRFTFRVRPRVRTFLLFPASNATNLAASAAAMWLLVEVAGIHPLVSTVLGGLLATPATYLVSRLILNPSNGCPGASRGGQMKIGKTW